ncbi:MAG: PLP-dependent aminotransferase family protein [Dehalococcoidia bacterium]|nr:PLP-dependent aminotransferase family protein [Dehalococcoidia bacterium]MDP7261187.1 PLP-dependent aminotransferase family protein [Dehalococcoidia bacterium]MDP7485884.1 PLP-dependent aminotransferase family protein [Dehalococcoidia bacterium]
MGPVNMVDTFSYDTLYSEKSIDDPLKPAAHATYDFAVAYPAPETLPMDGLIQALQVAVDSDSEKVLAEMAYYPQQLGALELREYTCAKLAADRGFTVTPEEVALTNGSGEALGLVIQALTNPGDVVLAEEFVYMGTTAQLRRFGADIRGIAMDKGGIIPEALDDQIVALTAAGEKPKYLYTIPEHQNPVGSTLSTERRKAILKIAHKHGMPILEDDCYVDLRYKGEMQPAFRALDDSGIVVYVASYSKLLAPGLRMGYFTASPELMRRALSFKIGSGPNQFAAVAIEGFLKNNLDSHRDNFTPMLEAKCASMLASLEKHFGDSGATWSTPEGGCYVWLTMPESSDIASIRDEVFQQGVGYVAGTNFEADASGRIGSNCARLCFAFESVEKNAEGIALLAQLFKRHGQM